MTTWLEVARVNWPVTIVTCLYMYEAVICYRSDKIGQAIMFVGYTIGNIGILRSLF